MLPNTLDYQDGFDAAMWAGQRIADGNRTPGNLARMIAFLNDQHDAQNGFIGGIESLIWATLDTVAVTSATAKTLANGLTAEQAKTASLALVLKDTCKIIDSNDQQKRIKVEKAVKFTFDSSGLITGAVMGTPTA